MRADGDDGLGDLRDSGGIKIGTRVGHFSDRSYQVALGALQYRFPEPGRELRPEQEATCPQVGRSRRTAVRNQPRTPGPGRVAQPRGDRVVGRCDRLQLENPKDASIKK